MVLQRRRRVSGHGCAGLAGEARPGGRGGARTHAAQREPTGERRKKKRLSRDQFSFFFFACGARLVWRVCLASYVRFGERQAKDPSIADEKLVTAGIFVFGPPHVHDAWTAFSICFLISLNKY